MKLAVNTVIMILLAEIERPLPETTTGVLFQLKKGIYTVSTPCSHILLVRYYSCIHIIHVHFRCYTPHAEAFECRFLLFAMRVYSKTTACLQFLSVEYTQNSLACAMSYFFFYFYLTTHT